MLQLLMNGQTVIIILVNELKIDNFWNIRGALILEHLIMIFAVFRQFFCSYLLSLGIKTLEFLESQMYSTNAGLIGSSMGKLSLEYVVELTNL